MLQTTAIFYFILINFVGIALTGAAYFQGWITEIVGGDSTRIVFLITALFLLGLFICGKRLWIITKNGVGTGGLPLELLKLKYSNQLSIVRYIANSLVFLGLIGTVIGFIIALSGVDPETSGNVDAVSEMVAYLVQGMSVALYTTLVGAILNVWLMANYRLLLSTTVGIVTDNLSSGKVDAT